MSTDNALVPADLYHATGAHVPALVDRAAENLQIATMAILRDDTATAFEYLAACQANVGAVMALLRAPPTTRPD